jgi:eukaryotic-like serine/threonine-protein kinase
VASLDPVTRDTPALPHALPALLAAALADRYRLERELGAGGMATVYLAEDVRHGRKVAVKVLRPELSAILGSERFLKEIEVTARLQHPHVLPLFDSGAADGRLFYVMPYVEGETLRARLEHERPLPIADALRISTELADALQYAHERGVVHRDIKPENILLQNGHALVADFGIALAVEQAGGQRMTQTGISLGTPAYMSPEQAMGEREIGPRADIYALGAVAYEMLVGEAPFTGPNAQAILAQVLTADPPRPSAHRRSVPAHVDAAVQTALQKLPADRWRSASEFAAALNVPSATSRAAAHRDWRGVRRWPVVLGAAAALLGAAIAGAVWGARRGAATVDRPLRASLLPPDGCDYASVATTNLVQLSPAGDRLAFIAVCGSRAALWIRTLATGELRELPGTSNAAYMFWSPNGASLGFFADGRLKRIDLASNAVRDLAPALNGRGGTWNQDDVILYAPDVGGPLLRISASGGTPAPVTSIVGAPQGTSHRMPQFLPDGLHFLFVDAGTGLAGSVRVGALGTSETRVLLDAPSNIGLARGRLLFATGGLLFARPFDERRAVFTGPAVSLVPGLENWPYRYLANFSVAAAGDVLVFRPAIIERSRAVWFDPTSQRTTTLLEPGPYLRARLAARDHGLIAERRDPDTGLRTLALYDIAAQTWSVLSRRPAVYFTYAGSPDGRRIGYFAEGDSAATISSPDRTVARTERNGGVDILDWFTDSLSVVGQRQQTGTGWDIVRLDLGGGSARVTPLLATAADESGARLSPDGRMLALVSNESGREELYVTRVADTATRWQISTNGVLLDPTAHRAAVAWSRTGSTIYFADPGGHLLSVSVGVSPSLHVGRATPVTGAPDGIVDLDAAADGRLLLLRSESSEHGPLELFEHWAGR